MKTANVIKGWVLGVMLIFGATASYAGEGVKALGEVVIHPYLDTDYSIISFSNTAEKSATFSIVDKNGISVYKEWVNKTGFKQKVVDFSYLEDGVYTAVLKVKGAENVTKTFAVANHKLVSKKAKVNSEKELKAFFNLVDDMLYVSHISFGTNSFGISISDEFSDEVFRKGFVGNVPYTGKFDISALPRGQYKVCINSGDKEYSYAFRK